MLTLAKLGVDHDADRRRRTLEIARMRIALDMALLSPADRARIERARLIERARRGP